MSIVLKISGILYVIVAITAFAGCDFLYDKLYLKEKVSEPKEAIVDLSDTTLNEITEENKDMLLRYFASSDRWEVRFTYPENKPYAVRRQKRKDSLSGRCDQSEGTYVTSHDGFYECCEPFEYPSANSFWKRVAIYFDKPYMEKGDTLARVGSPSVQIVVKDPNPERGFPDYRSHLVVEADDLFLSIYELSSESKRSHTQTLFNDVSKEIKEVLLNSDIVSETGLLPVESPYFTSTSSEQSFVVKEGYLLEAWLCLKKPGIVYAKVYDVKTGISLLDAYQQRESKRSVGWCENKTLCYPYKSLVIVSGPESHYTARFELWHRDDSGKEEKISETIRDVESWRF